jgi:hypothetical protein
MILHFIFVIKENDRQKRSLEFEYIKQMSNFFKVWIKKKFDIDFEIQCDELITKPRSILQKLDIHTLIQDHEQRGKDIYHFYLCHFKPLWTDCTCEGYHAENFGMIWWQQPKNPTDTLFLAEKNCSTVSHELTHELLRVCGYKKFIEDVHEIWTKHFYDQLYFEQYGADFKLTNDNPMFLTIDTSNLKINKSQNN